MRHSEFVRREDALVEAARLDPASRSSSSSRCGCGACGFCRAHDAIERAAAADECAERPPA